MECGSTPQVGTRASGFKKEAGRKQGARCLSHRCPPATGAVKIAGVAVNVRDGADIGDQAIHVEALRATDT